MITHKEAQEKAEAGMALATDKAERDLPGWSDNALSAIEKYLIINFDQQFLAEDVRGWAETMGLVDPPENARAWGSVFRRALSMGMIRRVGYAPARSSNNSPKCLWEAA